MKNAAHRGHTRRLISLVLGPLLLIAVLLMPAPSGMTAAGQKVAAVVLLMAVWWIGEAVPIAVTALLPLCLFPLLGTAGIAEVAPCYADQIIFLFLGGFLIAVAIQKWNLHRRIAFFIMKIIGTRPAMLVLGFMIATAALSMWISNTATTMMMLPIAVAVVDTMARQTAGAAHGSEQAAQSIRNNFGLVVMLAIAYSASIGGVGTLIGTPPNVMLAGQFKTLFPELPQITFLQWMMIGLPVVVVFIPVAWLYLVRFGAPVALGGLEVKGTGKDIIEQQARSLGRMSRGEWSVCVVFVLTALLWVFRADINLGSRVIPGWSRLLPEPGFIKDSTVAVAMAVLLFLIPVDFKKRIFVLEWSAAREIPWGVLILFGGGFALAQGMSSSGLAVWIGDKLSLMQHVSLPVLVASLCMLLVLLTELTSNTATVAMMLPVIAAMAKQTEVHPLLMMIPATMAASFAFVLPVATPPNAIVMGSGWVTIPRMARAGVILDVIGIIIVTCYILMVKGLLFPAAQ